MLLLASSVCGLFKWRQFEPEMILVAVGWNCAFPFRTATSRSCSPSGACVPITSPSGGGSSAMARKWNNVCVGDPDQPTTVGVWMRPTSGVKGKWVYLYRAVDSTGATIDFLL